MLAGIINCFRHMCNLLTFFSAKKINLVSKSMLHFYDKLYAKVQVCTCTLLRSMGGKKDFQVICIIK